ncbi:MAG TPA: hypothetical protein VHW90_01745 [Stellaceae bacterium]|jgi:hypothetical protein|nr:hypothetical protein [Stellaceae bacterium]
MRTIAVVGLLALLCPAAVQAQTAPAATAPPGAAPPSATAPLAMVPPAMAPRRAGARGADITRDEYIERAVERAKRAATTRFDRLDANHDGILTADERRAARPARRGGAPPE